MDSRIRKEAPGYVTREPAAPPPKHWEMYYLRSLGNPPKHRPRGAIPAFSHNEDQHLPTLLIINDPCRPECRTFWEPLQREAKLWVAADPSAALALACAVDTIPDLVVVLQLTPTSARNRSHLQQLVGYFPITPRVCVVGNLAVGEARTGQPPEGFLRVPWHAWPFFWQQLRETFQHGRCSLACLPSTATVEEQVVFRTVLSRPAASCHSPSACGRSPELRTEHTFLPERLGIVVTPLWENYRLLRDILHPAGYRALWIKPGNCGGEFTTTVSSASVFVVDIIEDLQRTQALVEAILGMNGQAGILVLSCFPRPEEAQTLAQLGNVVIIDKPFDIGELHAALTVLHHRQGGAGIPAS